MKNPIDLVAQAAAFADRYNMLPPGSTILVALSGGGDSMALLSVLEKLAQERDLHLHAAHFNHQLRGEESQRDETFVTEWCEKRNIPLIIGQGDVAQEAKAQGKGVEETARAMRYGFLTQAAQDLGADKLATAHHADDNAETVLLHLVRGAGLDGLTGIPPVRGILIRPLLAIPQSDIAAYLEQEGIPCAAPAQEDCWQDPLCAAVLRLAIARGQGEAPVPVSDDAESDDLLPLLEQALDLAPDAPLPDPQALQARLSGHSRLPAPLWQGTAWKQLCRAWQDCGQWEALVQQLGLQHEAELIRARSEQVQILTLHASKGLEFSAVFVAGVSAGMLPLEMAGRPTDLAEERRLLYVGMTRAREELVLLSGGEPSRFLAGLPLRQDPAHAPVPRPLGVQLSLFK